jgi:ADP-heptose:LPS heptosyltransferase
MEKMNLYSENLVVQGQILTQMDETTIELGQLRDLKLQRDSPDCESTLLRNPEFIELFKRHPLVKQLVDVAKVAPANELSITFTLKDFLIQKDDLIN